MNLSGKQFRIGRASGFSVVELLIALGLGLMIVAGIVQLFVGNSRTFEIVTAQTRLQESARFSFDFISRPARLAGYFGCDPTGNTTVMHLGGGWDSIPEYDFTALIDGWEAIDDDNYAPDNLISLPTSTGGVNTRVHIEGNGIDTATLIGGSDILVLRTLELPVARLAETLQPTGDPVLHTPGGEPEFAAEDVVFLSDCRQGALFKVTGVAVGADTTTLFRATSAGGANYDNKDDVTLPTGEVVPSTLSYFGRSYGADATVARFQSNFFFVAESAQLDNNGDPVPALWTKQGTDAPMELVRGVEDMQILYGIGTRYLPINQALLVAEQDDIVSIQVTLRISSIDPISENQDGGGVAQPLRRTFTKTIFVRNSDFAGRWRELSDAEEEAED